MAIGDIIVGIDIGTSKVSTVVGEVNNFNQIEIICSTNCKCFGIQKGKFVNEDEISSAIAKTIREAEEISNLKINSAYTTIPGKHVTIVQNSIVKDAKDKLAGISIKDVASAIIQVRDIEIPEDKVLIDIVPDKFILEDGKAVEDPVGKFSSRFTLTAQIILAEKEYVKQLTSIFKKAGIEIDEEHLTINNAFLEPLPKITKEELIKYIKDAFDNGIKGKYDDNATIQFVIDGNKLIPVGGNEVNDYFIKLVE